MEKFIIFDGKSFCRDEKTGYYCYNNGKRTQRLHRYVYEFYNGKIPNGFDVHHVDGNKNNNDISNLVILTRQDHAKIHGEKLTEEQRQQRRENVIKNANPKASEWHGSEVGRNWHKEHYEKMKQALYKKTMQTCKNCNKEFLATREGFCCNNCKSAYRRKMGFDNVIRFCVICGRSFSTNKYKQVKTCSKDCSIASREKTKKNKLNSFE
jgi:hypothetical protein